MFEMKNGVCLAKGSVYRYVVFHYYEDPTKWFVTMKDVLNSSSEEIVISLEEFLTSGVYVVIS